MPKIIGVAEVKRHFSEVLVEISRHGERFIVEKKGKPMIALVNLDDFESIKRPAPFQKRGLLAAIGAWEEYNDMENIVTHIYKKRKAAHDRKVKELP